ncbi:MAG: ribulose-phosphate 3-epimerase [Candidatus Dadabacteria bacterium]|nr:ribulose-phosphate 3-epimerase [Candidatus Dadabacteria bacterium]
MKKFIVPSILSADFTKLGEEVKAVQSAGADWIHVDVMDGHFVPNITIGVPVVKSLQSISPPPIDIHLMINNPEGFVETFIDSGGSYVKSLTVQVESCNLIYNTIKLIQSKGVMAGVAINPGTPLSSVTELLPYMDMVTIMTVEPGFAEQKFIPSMISKIKQMRDIIDSSEFSPLIEVDGGIKLENIGEAAEAGADVFVSGSGIFKSGDYKGSIDKMRAILENAAHAATG